MKSYVIFLLLFTFICSQKAICQTNSITIDAVLNAENNTLTIHQKTVYYNKTDKPLSSIYFHNWANAYKHKHTPLAKRLLENHSKVFHFAKEKHRGYGQIKSITNQKDTLQWFIEEENIDILKVNLKKPLQPKNSIILNANYTVKIPKDRFTEYGVNSGTYNLRYWYLAPAVFDNEWQLFNNLDLDDLFSDFTNFNITITTPKQYQINSNLSIKNTFSNGVKMFQLKGNDLKEAQLNISKINNFYTVNFNDVTITSNIAPNKLDLNLKTNILKREFYFLNQHLGKLLNTNLYLDKIEYDKNPVYGFSQLPSFLDPFDDAFEYDVKMFKQMAKKYIEQLYIINQREDGWLADGIQHYLMMKYVERYYPNTKAIGKLANIWGVRSSSLAKLKFNEKYPYVYQFAARKNLDQALTTPKDSLSNFNRKIVNKYKAGIAIQFLNDYLDDINFHAQASSYLNSRKHRTLKSDDFITYFENISSKNLDWFKNDYINTNKKIDYTIKKVEIINDSIDIT
ncbi:MAG TPA: hypothetical protein VJ970_08080, partial [Flavobacteriaceae bacterium]|nr:hypothetical protein [Flavobacteriaceae bacterium]